MGSPDLYNDVHYYNPNQGVDFSGVKIANAPREAGQSAAYSANPLPAANQNSGRQRGSQKSVEYAGGSGGAVNYDNTTTGNTQPADGSAIAASSLPVVTAGSAANTSTAHTPHAVVAMNTDVTSLENSFNRQSVGYTAGSGATDPGGDPTGDPIPVGDGWPLLLLFVSVYLCWKNFKK